MYSDQLRSGLKRILLVCETSGILMDNVEFEIDFDLSVKKKALVFEGLNLSSHLDDHLSDILKI